MRPPETDALDRVPSVAADVPEVLFGGSRFVRWTLGPVATIAGLGLLLGDPGTTSQALWRAGVSSALLLLALVVWFPRRYGFAARIVSGLLFLACCVFVVELAWNEPTPAPGQRGESGLPGAIQALVTFGIPCLWFTLRGGRAAKSA